MKQIRFYSICILFLVTPIVYSGLYIPGFPGTLSESVFWISSIFIYGFEKVKVGFFFLPLLIALFAQIILAVQKKLTFSKDRWIFIGGIFVLWTGVCYFLNYSINSYFWFGSPEKAHGWFLWAGLLVLFWILETSSEKEKNIYLQTSCYSFFIVFLYAVFQKIGVDPLAGSYQSRLDSERMFSTLGNPNYLAGYALMLLPVLQVQNAKCKVQNGGFLFMIWIVSFFVIYWSKSYLAWVIFPLYGAYVLINKFVTDTRDRQTVYGYAIGAIVIVLVLLFSLHGEQLLAMQKVQGFIARWYLWQTGIVALFGSFGHFLFGYGPDGFLAVSEAFRHPLLSVFEDPAIRIDSSHNVVIDMLVRFGFLITAFLVYLVGRKYHTLLPFQREVLILFLCYFFFNIPVLVHFLVIVLILATAPVSEKIDTPLTPSNPAAAGLVNF